jgi:HEAT repeat protein
MQFCSALLALVLFAPPAQDPAGAFAVGGKQVPIRLVSNPIAPPPADFLAWDGWQYFSGQRVLTAPYRVASDWSEVSKQFEANKGKQAAVWRSKIVLVASTESLDRDANGVFRLNRDILTDEQIQAALESIARFKARITAEYGGRVDFVPDVEVERDPMYFSSYGPEFAQWLLGPRMNGGLYEAEDKVYRGPYNSAFYILPGYGSDPAPTTVNGTPVNGITLNAPGLSAEAGRLEYALREAWRTQAVLRASQKGYVGTSFEDVDPWPILTSLDEPETDAILQRLKSDAGLRVGAPPIDPFVPSWRTLGSEAAIVEDAERGKVLKVSERLGPRQGGIGLPSPEDSMIGSIEDRPTLTLMAKASDHDPISIRVIGSAGSFWISLGRDPILAKPTNAVVGSVPFEANGTWQKIAVDLRPLAKAAKVEDIVGLAIEPSANALAADSLEQSYAEYFFDDIKLSADPAAPLMAAPIADLASTDPESKALAIAAATASSPELIALVKDPSPLVRLNAAALFTRVKDPEAEANLSFEVNDLQPPIQAMALKALAFQGTETARNTLRNTIKYTVGDYVKATAATLLAESGESKYTGDMLILFTQNSWQTAIAAIQGLAKVNPGAPQARHVFLRSNSPAVRLAVVELADAKVSTDRSALQWHALNDPADEVRVAANAKLIASGDPVVAAEGYKGVRDDSRYARILLLQKMEKSPNAAHRPAIMIGLADKSALVRAAAVRALAAQPEAVSNEDLATVVNDLNPEVQLALIALAQAKGVQLPAATVSAMKQSPAKAVQEAAKVLG